MAPLLGTLFFWIIVVNVPDSPGVVGFRNAHAMIDPFMCEQVNSALQAQALTKPGMQVSPCEVIRVTDTSWNPKPAEIERAMGLPRHSLLQPGRLSTEAALCED